MITIKISKKLSIIALSLSLLSYNFHAQAKFSVGSIIPGISYFLKSGPNVLATNLLVAKKIISYPVGMILAQVVPQPMGTFVPNAEQLMRIKETMEDHSELDLSKISVEQDPVFFPESKEMVTVYADYKPEHNAENRLEKAKELRNWHAKVAGASALLTYLTAYEKKTCRVGLSSPMINIVFKLKESLKTYPFACFQALTMLNAGYAGIKAWEASDLTTKLKAAQDGDGDVARALERKAIAYQIQDME